MHRIDHQYATTGGWTGTGNISTGTAVITGIADTTGIKIGDYVLVNLGYPNEGAAEYKVLQKTPNTITISRQANADTIVSIETTENRFTDGDALTGVPRTIVTPEWANAIQEELVKTIETAGGTLNKYTNTQLLAAILSMLSAHHHSGADGNGNAALVDLETEVDGVLNAIHIGDHAHDGGSISKIILTNASDVTGQLPIANQEAHTHDGSSRPKIHPYNHISGVSEGDFTFELAGFTTTVEVTARYRLEEPIETGKPKIVTLSLPDTSGESNDMHMDTASNAVPTAIRPESGSVYIPVVVYNLGMEYSGAVRISSAGVISFLTAYLSSSLIRVEPAFGTSGTKGFPACTIKYPIYPAP